MLRQSEFGDTSGSYLAATVAPSPCFRAAAAFD